MPEGFLALFDQTERMPLSPPGAAREYWVEFKHYLTGDEDDACTRAMFRLGGGGMEMTAVVADDPKTAMRHLRGRVDNNAFTRALVLHSIVNWNLTDRNDQPLALAPAEEKERSVASLPAAVIDRIATRILEIRQAQKPSQAARATFRGEAERGDPDGHDGAPGAPGVPPGAGLLAASWPPEG